jgi:hypothetical protein
MRHVVPQFCVPLAGDIGVVMLLEFLNRSRDRQAGASLVVTRFVKPIPAEADCC